MIGNVINNVLRGCGDIHMHFNHGMFHSGLVKEMGEFIYLLLHYQLNGILMYEWQKLNQHLFKFKVTEYLNED